VPGAARKLSNWARNSASCPEGLIHIGDLPPRVETFGDHQENGTNDGNWLKVWVDADSREVFAYQQQIVPGNRVAVPQP